MMTRREPSDLIILHKLGHLPWGFMVAVTLLSCIGFAMLYSAARGDIHPWASRQMIHFCIGILLMLAVAVIDMRFWFRLAYFGYAFGIGLLLLVEFMGVEGGLGAQRWLSIGGFRIQPSEPMKVFLVLALARYYHLLNVNDVKKKRFMFVPLALIGLAAVLVLKQPNLGTAAILGATGVVMMFLGGVRLRWFILAGMLALALIPVAWTYILHDYQKQRVETFLDPESDPLGAGYNIIQSQIAIGSGGFWGKGFLEGTQSQLSFVPEKQTDFIFAMVAEEFGFLGGFAVIGLYALLIVMGIRVAIRSRSQFGKMITSGIIAVLFFHAFINIGMVMGVLPVVGLPLPLLSYGGSSMISTLVGFGFIMNARVHRKVKIYGGE